MLREHFRVKPYSDRRYKFVVRAKIDGKWRRRYFRNETEAQAYADEQNRRMPAKQERFRGRPSKNGRSGPAKEGSFADRSPTSPGEQPRFRPWAAQPAAPDMATSRTPRIDHYLGGAWRMHLPFAYDLIRELKPSIFVELGVYKGESYFAFCQSVEENKLPTRCYGIDTWQGDWHAGLYGPEIGRNVAAYNERYRGFSRLLTMTFRDALAHFEDGSVDLLHIDGAHRYEDVKEDFESWRPKLSNGAVVLFHDVVERDRGFGVYKLWEEIARPQASFLFGFGHGLGVWRENVISKKDPPFLQQLFLADAETKRAIVEHYATLAAAIEIETPAEQTLQAPEADLQVYPSRQGAACEERLSRSRLEPGRWGRLKIELPWGLGDGTAPCRIDPINSSGVVDLAAIRLRSAASGKFLWRADAKNGLNSVVAGGTSFSIPNPRFLRLLSYGPDPQIHLPSLPDKEFQDPLILDIVLRYELGTEALGRAIAALNQSAFFSGGAVSPTEVKKVLPGTAAEMGPHPDSGIDQADRIQMVVYSAGDSGYTEERSTQILYTGECWSRLNIALQLGLGTQPLRIDPLPGIGLIDIASLTLRSAINDEVYWRANGGGGLETLQVTGTAVRIPHPNLARVLSYGEDPQIYLPAFSSGRFDGPLRLEVWLKTETGIASIRKGISELADIGSKALLQESQSRGLLEQTSREASTKDAEIRSLKIELGRALDERDAARAELLEEQQRQHRLAIDQQAHLRNLEASRTGLESDLTKLQEAFHRAETETAQFTIELEAERSHRTSLEEQIKVLKADLENGAREKEEVQAALAQASREKEINEQKIASLVQQFEEAGREKEEQIQALRTHLENGAREREGMEAQLARASEEKESLKENTSFLAQQIADAKRHLARTSHDLKAKTFELQRIRQKVTITKIELELALEERDNAAAERDRSASQEKLRRSEAEKLHAELKDRASRLEHLALEGELLRAQLNVEETAKRLLIQQFTSAAESLSRVKKDLAVLREAESQKPLRGIRGFLGVQPTVAPVETRDISRRQPTTESYRFWLDSPNGPSVNGNKVFFSGWVLPSPGKKILAVRALVAGESFIGQYGIERPDVGEMFQDRPEAVRSAFSIGVSLGVGIHDIILQYLSEDGKWITFHPYQHEVLPGALSLKSETSASDQWDIVGWLENPRAQIAVELDLLLVSGWVHIHDADITSVIASVEDGVTAEMAYPLLRDDVAVILPGVPGARLTGFEGYLAVRKDFVGPLTVKVEAVLADDTRICCFQQEVTVSLPELPTAVPLPELSQEERYARWMETNKLTPYLVRKMAHRGLELAENGPLISLIVPTFNTPAPYLEELVESVAKQLYPHWQLCFADDASTEPHVRSILKRAAKDDSRIAVVLREVNGHIARASNSALALAAGDYVGLLDHDDLLSPDALLHVAEAIAADVSLDLLYTDEDKISLDGKRYDPIFKGSFSPEMSLTHNYIQHFTVMRKSLVSDVGGFRPGLEGAQDLDLYLRVLEKTVPERVKHLPFVCYHWRSHPESTASKGAQKTYVFESARKAITEALERRRLDDARPFLPEWAEKANCCLYQLKWSSNVLKKNPVTIVIPTKDRADLLRKCVASLERTVHPGFVNLIVVDDYSEEEATRQLLQQLTTVGRLPCRVIQPFPRAESFNFSGLVNAGVAAATTPLVLLLNNDTEALTPGWLEEMAGWMTIDGVAAVGAKLLYPDNTIQHAGVIVGPHGGLADHIFHGFPAEVIGFNFLTHAARNVSAVTAACILVSKAAFNELGGFDQNALAMEYNDVDFCLRLNETQKRVVFTPQAALLHYSSQSRGVGWRPAEHLTYLRRHGTTQDPYYNENLDLARPIGLISPNHFLHTERVGELNVLMISHNLNLEGAPKVLFDHAAYFVKSHGYKVTIVSREDGPLRKNIEEAGISLHIEDDAMPRHKEEMSAYLERLQTIGERLNAKSFDLVICNTLASFWGVVLAQQFKLPVIWHVHESTTIPQFFQFEPLRENLAENCFATADRVVFESGPTRRLLSRYQKRDNFQTIPGSIDVDAIDKFRDRHSQHSMKLKHGLDPNKMVVTLIGTTCPRKGQHVFIEAIARLQASRPNDMANISFVMLGARKSTYLDLLYKQLETIEGTDTRLIEECAEVFDFYRLTDIFVCASFQESFPRVILEAMAFQLPIVSTDVFGIPEIILHQSEGLLGPPGNASFLADAIEGLFLSPVAREELGARAHAKVTRLFNSRIQLRRQLDLTKEVVARHF